MLEELARDAEELWDSIPRWVRDGSMAVGYAGVVLVSGAAVVALWAGVAFLMSLLPWWVAGWFCVNLVFLVGAFVGSVARE